MASPPLLERFLRFVTPQPDLGFTPPPSEIEPGIWSIDRRARQVALPARSTAVDLGAGRLLLISPPADPCPELARLGSVSAIVAPNSFHYLHAAAWLQRHPRLQKACTLSCHDRAVTG